MQIDLYGGFGEKGRTSVGISDPETRILLDVGIKVGAAGRDYYPAIDAAAIAALDAVFVSHAHEDHIGGLSWLLSCGFRGPVFMTHETRGEADEMLAQYADPAHVRQFPIDPGQVRLFRPGDTLQVGRLSIATGRSGHVAGGVWFHVDDTRRQAVYCADVTPGSSVFVMDPVPSCDLILLDASYAADAVSGLQRRAEIEAWIAAHPGGCLLPVPASGKPLEIMAILPGRFAIHQSMREAIATQILARAAFAPATRELLQQQLALAVDWRDGEPFPDCPLLTVDGMGSAGPSVDAIGRAAAQDLPILLTGHIPDHTPARSCFDDGSASWIRLPTHPTRDENVAIWTSAGNPAALGHSCQHSGLAELQPFLPKLDVSAATGDHLEI
ncbi:MBL fold metallo-hydrolase [Hoeflea ulvae]|uniref:MBL fold metallo-hydrolase n=1 Tax=Hoeflea ulvae TaxID=2983764 RepID=A0ABT3YEF2_9HYPH|nr:MBL fold metallo-hydrolase [Hoeflea ulvae]MCY0094264.1 MBL fold metallo-hydrolase [Hoeflea ulvae]